MLFSCGGALGVAMLVALPLTRQILAFLTVPLNGVVEDPDRFLRSLRVAGAFTVALRIAAWSGLVPGRPWSLTSQLHFVRSWSRARYRRSR